MSHKYILWLFLTTPMISYSQTAESVIGEQMEYLADRLQSEIKTEELHESLMYYFENPIPINQATEDDLLQSPLFNKLQVKNLIQYRKLYGEILSSNEL
ncbi:MAG: hypothetical protein JEZ03_15000, partial [Bacteroidales bacterium]|nr:hypothetical protein [Bacteroidales bacterium]